MNLVHNLEPRILPPILSDAEVRESAPAPAGIRNPDPVVCELRSVVKKFGDFSAVDHLTLSIPRGRIVSLLGPNGAGKTTTMRIIAGIIQPTAGSVLINGIELKTEPERAKQRMAYLPDEPLIYNRLSAWENMEYIAALWNVPAAAAPVRSEELLRKLDLWESRHVRVQTFSRGMKQKLALASALVRDPDLLLLDEPLTGLDAMAAKEVKAMLTDFARNGGTAMVATHLLDTAERIADRHYILQTGRLKAGGTLTELRNQAGIEQGSLEETFVSLTSERHPR